MSTETYGSYELLRKLATGGMAQIYLARQKGPEGFEKLLVVKRILPHLGENEEFVRMFLDEARIAARLNHPNVVQIFNLGAQDDSFFIAMEYIHGEDVRRVWKTAEAQGRAVPIPLVCRIIMDSCAGLDYAHRKPDTSGKPLNIVHRDISPQNILVTFDGGVKVVDFGIAKAADQATITRSGVLKGKYSYMSPEQASGQRVDRRSDIFALGVVLYELLTGTRLFKRTTDVQTLNAVTDCDVQPPSSLRPELPADLDAIVMKALAKTPETRYQWASELQMALEDWLMKHQLPSSSSHLAVFMREIYAERLAKEAKEGQLLVEDEGKGEPAPAKKTPKPKVAPGALTVSVPQASLKESREVREGKEREAREARESREEKPGPPVPEATTAARPERSSSKSVQRTGRSTQGTKSPRPAPIPDRERDEMRADTVSVAEKKPSSAPAYAAAALVLVAAAAVGGFILFGGEEKVPVSVSLQTSPSGARAVASGRSCVTPCALQGLPEGPLEVSFSKAGYLPQKRQIEVPAEGELAVPSVSLEREAEVGDRPPTVADAGPKLVALQLVSNPAGADLSLDGKSLGRTPVSVSLREGFVGRVLLSLDGYEELEEPLAVSAQTPRVDFELRRVRGNVVVAKNPDRNPDKTPDKNPEKLPDENNGKRGNGEVKFIVPLKSDLGWARVSCSGGHDFGETPFPPKQMPAGDYQCTFSNPEKGYKKTVPLKVEANTKQTVSIAF